MPGLRMPEELQRRLKGRREERRLKKQVSLPSVPDVFGGSGSATGSDLETELPAVVENYVALAPSSPTKKPRRGKNLLPAFNNASEQEKEWVVIALDDDKENVMHHPAGMIMSTSPEDRQRWEALGKIFDRQDRASRKRLVLLRERVNQARRMSTPPSKAKRVEGPSPVNLRLERAEKRKASMMCARACRAKELTRLRTPRRKRSSPDLIRDAVEERHAAADQRRQDVLATRAGVAARLGVGTYSARKMEERRMFRKDEIEAKLQAAEERRSQNLLARRAKAAERTKAIAAIMEDSERKRQALGQAMRHRLEAAAGRRANALAQRVKRAGELGEGSVLIWMNRRRVFLSDVLSARLQEAADRRASHLESRRARARTMSGDSVAEFIRLEGEMMRAALTNLWRLKLEAATSRRNIRLIMAQRKAYEMGDAIVRASNFEKMALLSLGLTAKLQAAEAKRNVHLAGVAQKARRLGDKGANEKRRRVLSEKALALIERIEAAEAKRKRVLASKSKKANELGSERVEKSQICAKAKAAIQDCARVGRIKAAENRRNQNLFTLQTAAARNNARAAAIASFVSERHQFEKEIGERYIHFKLERAQMNRDVAKLLRCGLRTDPTFSLVKPIAFIV
ncbi:hypothetical protein HOP50_05g36980 [Chloropicon primus]|uniref:Uncharacterized protein n=1 Tax=Chloropicon primus TaxID=1764295 RepID=A0A5B8MPG5_9CHLO|nr:hypothetical protein A3770_05p36900 [Chloropicon primus]UPR00384.1 hypothetical protein HOP50_05g36980 [Chloropicon primus]|eukprot:QDZ21172.1 hypothetical protein A3770_05p36900 [Chloropicon primus]